MADDRPGGAIEPLDIQDYLDASSDAAVRTRNASIALVIASVLLFAGLLNSLQSSWMLQRLQNSSHWSSPYVATKIGPPPDTGDRAAMEAYGARYQQFYGSLVRSYVENAFVIRVPFFGFAIDANDLGLVGGVAFVVLLVMFRFCVSREVDNLRTSFEEAEQLGQLQEFYKLLSMRQVFTIPPSGHIRRTAFLVWTPKLFCFAPLAIYLAVCLHDVVTGGIGQILSDAHTRILFVSEWILAVSIAVLTAMAITRLRRLDSEWETCWNKLLSAGTKTSALAVAPSSAQAFRNDVMP